MGDKIVQKGFFVISDCLHHDAIAVYTFMKLFIEHLKENVENIKIIDYFSDGAPQQVKNFKNILNTYFHEEDHGIPAIWHYFPTAHGKGACDGIGGSVKRNAAKASLVLPPERQILTALQLYNWLKNDGNYKDVHFAYSPESEYMKNFRHLNSRFNITDRVKHLRKQHYIRPLKNKSTVVCKHHSSMR